MTESTLYKSDKRSFIDDEEYVLLQEAQTSLAGFENLYLQWLSPVYRYFYFRVGNSKESEDLTARVFLKVYEDLPHYHEHGYFSAWLFTIVRNQAIDYFRTRTQEIPLDFVNLVDESHDLLSQAVHSDEIQRLQKLIWSLPEEEQEMIRLRFVVELGYREIGIVLNRKEDAIRKSIVRLLTRMKNQLETSYE